MTETQKKIYAFVGAYKQAQEVLVDLCVSHEVDLVIYDEVITTCGTLVKIAALTGSPVSMTRERYEGSLEHYEFRVEIDGVRFIELLDNWEEDEYDQIEMILEYISSYSDYFSLDNDGNFIPDKCPQGYYEIELDGKYDLVVVEKDENGNRINDLFHGRLATLAEYCDAVVYRSQDAVRTGSIITNTGRAYLLWFDEIEHNWYITHYRKGDKKQ